MGSGILSSHAITGWSADVTRAVYTTKKNNTATYYSDSDSSIENIPRQSEEGGIQPYRFEPPARERTQDAAEEERAEN